MLTQQPLPDVLLILVQEYIEDATLEELIGLAHALPAKKAALEAEASDPHKQMEFLVANRANILVEQYLSQTNPLAEAAAQLIRQPGDSALILAHTIHKLQKEKAALLDNHRVSAEDKDFLNAHDPALNIDTLLALDARIDNINMGIVNSKLPSNEEKNDTKEILLMGLGLTRLPEQLMQRLQECSELKSLLLQDNRLTSVPASLGNLGALTRLWLYNNQLTSVPVSLGNLRALTDLSLAHNQLTSVPASLGNLRALTALFLNNNQLTSLPESFANLEALTELYPAPNPFTTLPESIRIILQKTSNQALLDLIKPSRPPLTPLFAMAVAAVEPEPICDGAPENNAQNVPLKRRLSR